MKYPPTNLIHAVGLADAWGQAVNFVMKNGMEIQTEYGPKSKDICSTIEILEPYTEPMLHPQFPTKELHVREYLKQWERGYDWKKQGFEYNYMDRLINYPSRGKDVDQLKAIADLLPQGISRRRQAITWIPERDLFVKEDQPCLQRLWVRALGNGNAELHCMWRSRDLYAAWNSNMVGLVTMIKREVLEPNSLKLVKVVDFCNSLHIYEADWEAASKVKPVPKSPQMMRY
ncbi:MAG TPA: thymidylate synthase [Candidatus Methanoperedens sp.]|nr:thymidylate synthase [Candidatus Methanoperedens sp.]HLB71439.1 thymidylate synthase [Candidatus Methanoperedens sp.]